MIREWTKRFWDDFELVTQIENPDMNFVNPADVARSLIKARNWTSKLVQASIESRSQRTTIDNQIREAQTTLDKIERTIFAKSGKIPAFSMRNRETQSKFLFSIAEVEEREQMQKQYDLILYLQTEFSKADDDLGDLETMRRALEKSADWLIQYLNWYKYEMRTLVE
jgi:hypothetical protein